MSIERRVAKLEENIRMAGIYISDDLHTLYDLDKKAAEQVLIAHIQYLQEKLSNVANWDTTSIFNNL